MTQQTVSVLFVGDRERGEFADVFAWLRDNARLAVAADCSAAAGHLSGGDFDPELIVVAQSWPGEFSPREIDRLRRAAPLARVSELLGSWCEGETRTGRPAGGTLRNYWHQWLPRMAPEFARAARGERSIWSLPPTATDDERLVAAGAEHRLTGNTAGEVAGKDRAGRGLIAILLQNGMMARALCDACPTRGYACAWLPRGRGSYLSGVRALVWDAPSAVDSWAETLVSLGREWRNTPIVALASFPRIEDVARLRAAGAAAVVSKPMLLDDLFWQLEQL